MPVVTYWCLVDVGVLCEVFFMLFSRKDLFKIIAPLILQQLLSVSVGMIDSMMVSSAGETAVSGVSLVSTLDLLLIYVFMSLATGGAVVVSQALGRGDGSFARRAAKQLIYAVAIAATAITIVVLIFRIPLLDVLFGDAEDAVMRSAQDYFLFAALSFPFLGIYDGIAALFRAMGNSMVSLKISIVINIVNVTGNAVLIYGFGLGAAGAAIATLIARAVGAAIMIVLIHNKSLPVFVEKILKYRPDFKIIKNILRIGVPNSIENGMFQFGKLMTQSLISSLGTVSIAANAVASSMATLQYVPGNAINAATVPIVGRCVGAGEKKQAKKYSLILLGTAYFTLFAVVLFMSLAARPIISLYGLTDESSVLARQLILYHGLCGIVIWPIAFCTPNVFRAASDVRFTLVVSASSMWVFRVALSYVMALGTVGAFGLFTFPGLGLGVMGVWMAMTVDWLFRAIMYLVHYLRGKWLTKYDSPQHR